MNSTDTQPSPRLDGLLRGLRGRLVRLVWLHGLGTVVAGACGWFLFAFLADWLLHVPTFVRVLHTAIWIAIPVMLFRREVLAHLAKVPGPAGLAQLIERRHPETADLLVSAVQLAPTVDQAEAEGMPGRSELVRRLVDRAERVATDLKPDEALAPRLPQRRAFYGVAASGAVIVLALAQPGLFSIFVQRMFGASVSWPQRTQLTVEVPLPQDFGTQEEVATEAGAPGTDELRLRVARGTDVPVLVHATGVVPDEVTVHFSSGKKVRIASGGRALFRTAITSVQEDMEFWVTGGDDLDGEPRVLLTVLQPPDVSGLAIAIEPPEYSGLPTRFERGPDVEVLAGSRLTVYVEPDPVDAFGVARLLPRDEVLELTAGERPWFPEEDPTAGAVAALSFSIDALESLRYRFELRDSTGLPNPDPGLYAVTVKEDRRPELLMLSPGRAEMPVVPGGALPLRVRVEDDFGLGTVAWTIRDETSDPKGDPLREVPLDVRLLPADHGVRGVGVTRLEVNELAGNGAEAPAEASVYVLQVQAEDNRADHPGQSLSAPIRLRVVSADDLQRRLQDDLARAGEQAGRLQKLEEERLSRARELLSAMSSDELEDGGDVVHLLGGLRRIEGDARALGRNLAAISESLLYARIDDRATPLLEALEAGFSEVTDRSFHPEPWLQLGGEYVSGNLGQAGLAGQLVEIVALALLVSEVEGPAATEAMQVASRTMEPVALRSALEVSIARQEEALATTDRLLELLSEWDNFNSVLTATRDLLNHQKNLTERTRQHAKNK